MVALLFASLFAQAQFSNDTVKRKTYNNRIFVSPINFTDPINPSLQIGYERSISKNTSLQIEYGLITRRSFLGFLFVDYFGYDKTYWYTNKGYKVRTEIKKHKSTRSNFVETYKSIEIFYMKNRSNVNDLFFISDTTFDYSFDELDYYNGYIDFFTVNKRKIGLNFKYGYNFYINDHWVIEMYVGLGISQRKSTHTDRLNPNDEFYDNIASFNNLNGTKVLINVPLNAKIGYKF